jgi:hypothetical protein
MMSSPGERRTKKRDPTWHHAALFEFICRRPRGEAIFWQKAAYLLVEGLGLQRRFTLESSRGTAEWLFVAWREPREWRLRAF